MFYTHPRKTSLHILLKIKRTFQNTSSCQAHGLCIYCLQRKLGYLPWGVIHGNMSLASLGLSIPGKRNAIVDLAKKKDLKKNESEGHYCHELYVHTSFYQKIQSWGAHTVDTKLQGKQIHVQLSLHRHCAIHCASFSRDTTRRWQNLESVFF